ncbi:hypothetical protein K9B35_14400 [Sphingomonas sp. R647]|uniref:hypothetical protein n=1 Tax=Sphingomonas sp. R647 TaxID=2875233 RepID=UPI001CD317B5|nr:hypothetical protein [Sphingomonas sp. R647]MCA1199165.1 hypothetical protein [Sphingomonas sp. R647]
MKARRAIRAAHAATIVVGIAVALAALRRPAEAVIAAAIAAFLIILALLWQLKQEDKR